jgi:plastocyanin
MGLGKSRRKGSTRRLLLATAGLCCALCVLGPAAAVAAPAWLPATDASGAGKDATNPAVAIDDAGNTVLAWERQDIISHNVELATRSPGGNFTAPVTLSPASTIPRVAMTSAGEAIAFWRHFDVNSGDYVLQVSSRPPGGSFSTPVDVSASETNAQPQGLRLAVNAAGDIALAWVQKDPDSLVDPEQFSVRASIRPAGGSFSTPEIISPLPLVVGNSAGTPRVALDGAGNTTAVWRYFDGTNQVIQAATRPAGGAFSGPIPLTTDGADAGSPDVAMDAVGDAIAVWVRSDGSNLIVHASTSPAGGAFAAPVDLSEPGEDAFTPEIAMSPQGEATATWVRSNVGGDVIVQVSQGSPGGSFSSPLDLSGPGEDASDPEPARNSGGATTVIWRRGDVVQASIAQAGGGFSSATDLSLPGQVAVSPAVAMDRGGDATVVWFRSNGTNNVIQAAGYDANPPELRDLSIPSSGTAGAPVLFSVSPFDVWPLASTSFSFGDGGVAAGTSASHVYEAAGTYEVTATAKDAAGTPATASGTIVIRPSGKFSLGKLSLNKKKGTATIVVSVSSPGKLVLSGKGAKKVTKRARAAGKVKLQIKATGKALRQLELKGKAKLQLKIAFTPDGGAATVKHRTVVLIKQS